MPLTTAGIGDVVCIMKISGKDDTKEFLENLGFIAGETVTIVSDIGGKMVLYVKNSHVAIDKEIARKIMI